MNCFTKIIRHFRNNATLFSKKIPRPGGEGWKVPVKLRDRLIVVATLVDIRWSGCCVLFPSVGPSVRRSSPSRESLSVRTEDAINLSLNTLNTGIAGIGEKKGKKRQKKQHTRSADRSSVLSKYLEINLLYRA